jgi:regulator of protease activity HflC (stomatin/prohibitin superfamily)
MKIFKTLKSLWTGFYLVNLTLSLIFPIALFVAMNYNAWYLLTGLGFFIILTVVTIYRSIIQVPQNQQWTIELFGECVSVWGKGLHFRFPYFNVVNINSQVYMGEQIMALNMDESMREGFGKGVVDFENGSAPVVASVYFTIVDAMKATYNINDVFRGIEEKMDSAIRSYLADYTIDVANKLKPHFDLARTLYKDKHSNGSFPAKQAVQDNQMWKDIRDNWGVEINSIVISDIVMSPEIIATREKKMTAEIEMQAAEDQKKTVIIQADAQREATIKKAEGKKRDLELVGEGLKEQIKILTSAGLTNEQATDYLINKIKWENIGASGNSVIIDNGGGIASIGAQFGAGLKAGQNPKKP